MECLPLTCCPMFAVPRNIFEDELRGGALLSGAGCFIFLFVTVALVPVKVMTDMDLRGGGYVDFAYNFFPWMSDLPMRDVDMQRMPGRVLFWMSTLHCDPNLTRLLKPEFLNKDRL